MWELIREGGGVKRKIFQSYYILKKDPKRNNKVHTPWQQAYTVTVISWHGDWDEYIQSCQDLSRSLYIFEYDICDKEKSGK